MEQYIDIQDNQYDFLDEEDMQEATANIEILTGDYHD